MIKNSPNFRVFFQIDGEVSEFGFEAFEYLIQVTFGFTNQTQIKSSIVQFPVIPL